MKKIKGIDDNKVSLSTLKNLKGSLENRVREIYRQAYKEGFEDGKESVTREKMSEYIITCKDDPNDDGSFGVRRGSERIRKMSRYVDANEILRELRFVQKARAFKDSEILGLLIKDFEKMQEHIVRCKDCKWYDADGEEMDTQGHCWYKNGEPVMQDMKPNDYCSYGEKKDG